MKDIETMVCEDIKRRQELGIKKYGVTVADNPLSLKEWLTHSYQEQLDNAVYLRRAIETCERLEAENRILRELLKEVMFRTGDDPRYNRHGYSLRVEHETSFRDVNYRNAPLYPTADEAIDAEIKESLEGRA